VVRHHHPPSTASHSFGVSSGRPQDGILAVTVALVLAACGVAEFMSASTWRSGLPSARWGERLPPGETRQAQSDMTKSGRVRRLMVQEDGCVDLRPGPGCRGKFASWAWRDGTAGRDDIPD